MTGKPPVVWLLDDQKPGHRSQLKGLGNRLRVLCGANLHWLDATTIPVPVWRALFGLAPRLDLPRPDLIIAAGRRSHRLLLSLRRLRGARTLVLMKPGFPLSWVDGAIIPAHDGVPERDGVLVSEGALNAMTPMARLTDKPEALILLGGPSPHYEWDNDRVLQQVTQLIQNYRDWRWTISGSRRTPPELQAELEALAGPRITVVDHSRTHQDWLSHTLAGCRAAWVTPDSVSMVYEVLTAGLPTGLFELPPRQPGRVVSGIEALLERGRVASWQDHARIMQRRGQEAAPLWEADRAARWVIQRFLGGGER